MLKKLLVSLLLVGTLLFVSSCSKEPTEESSKAGSEEPTEHYDIFLPLEDFQNQSHIDTAVSAKVGEKLKVILEANPTLGFQWQENVGIVDASIIRQAEHRFVPSKTDALGSPGQDVWTFEALKKGTTIISIECSRPWEDRNLGVWEITITTTVK